MCGGNAYWSFAEEAIQTFSEIYKAPIFTNGLSRGLLGRLNKYSLNTHRREALGNADLVLSLGVDFDFRLDYGQGISENAKIIHVDIDPGVIGRNRSVDISVNSSVRAFIDSFTRIRYRIRAQPRHRLDFSVN